jgi:hypothetical protein
MNMMIAVLVVVGAVFALGMLLGQRFSHREVHRRERELADVRRQRNELVRELRARSR